MNPPYQQNQGYHQGYQPGPGQGPPPQGQQPGQQWQQHGQQTGQPQYPPPASGQYPPPGQQPYAGQYGAPGQYPPAGQYPPQGQPPQQYPQQGQPPQQYPQHGQPPQQYSQQGQPPQQYPQQGQPPQQYQGQPPYQGQSPYGAPPPQPPQGYPGTSPQPYGQQPYGAPPGQPAYPGQPPQQPYGAPPPQQWQQQQPYGAPAPPAPASAGYDPMQKQYVQHVDTSSDVEALRKAMKGMGCDERALIKVVTSPKYSNPWAMQQLVADYNKRFMRDLLKDIKSETRGVFEDGLLALLRGPLENDVRTLDKAMDRAGTDEIAVADVLLGRTNADMAAIVAEYKRIEGKSLLAEIKSEFDESLTRLYSMALSATKAEPSAPVIPHEIDVKATEVHQATEGVIGSNAVAVASVFASLNDAQLHAVDAAYQRKYHRNLQDVIEKEFRGDTEDAFLYMLAKAKDRAKADADWLRTPLTRSTGVKDKHFLYRITTLYWDRPRLEAAKDAYEKQHRRKLESDVKAYLGGDFEDLVVALIGGKR